MRAVLLATVLLATPASAAILRPYTQLAAPSVRLSDLFDQLGATADRAIGPSPAPGSRILVLAPQLEAIASEFGVDWLPNSSDDQAVLERAGAPLPEDAVLAALRPALTAAGAAPDGRISLHDLAPVTVPAGTKATPQIADLAYDPATGGFSATLLVPLPDAAPMRTRIAGEVVVMLSVLAPTHRLRAGMVIAAEDVHVIAAQADLIRGEAARLPEQAVGLAVRQDTPAGVPLELSELVHPVLVFRGNAVSMGLDAGGLHLTAQGIAMEPGGLGDRIRVLNPGSRAIVVAEIEGGGRVRVDPNSTPVQAPAGTALPGATLDLADAR